MKKRLNFLFAVITWFFVIACEAGQGYRPVSLVELIVLPEKSVGKKIMVKGFFEVGISAAVYSNHISAEIMDTSSSIIVLDPTSSGELTLSCDKTYVAIKGRFIESHNQYVIADVVRVLKIGNLESCWERSGELSISK